MGFKSYRDLEVWQKAMDLVVVCYQITNNFPKSEIYGLTSQLQRAAISVPANIAEGHGRRHLGDYLQHLSIANGSLKELETHFFIATRLAYLQENDIEPVLQICSEVGRMLAGLISKLKSRQS